MKLSEKKHLTKRGVGIKGVKSSSCLLAVVTDGFNRAALKCLHANRDFIFGHGLLVHERIATFIMTREESRSSFAAKIAVDALLIDEELTCCVLRPLVCFISHIWWSKLCAGILSSGRP
jgi:hypothetical protein